MVRLFGLGLSMIGLLLAGIAWRTVALSVVFDCIACQCSDTSVPSLLSVAMGLLYAIAALAAFYVAIKAFTWQGRPPQNHAGEK